MKRYEIIDHTADIGLRSYGETLEELFVNSAFGMFEIIADLNAVNPKESIQIKTEASGYEELLVSFLRELLYLYSVKEILFKDFTIKSLSENHLHAEARGEKISPQKHTLKAEIKAVTYHQLKIEKKPTGYQAQLIFDI